MPPGNPSGTGAAALGPMNLQQGLEAYKARNPSATSADVVVSQRGPEDGYDEELAALAETQGTQEGTEGTEGEEALEPAEGAEPGEGAEEEAETQEPAKGSIMLPDGSTVSVEEARVGYLKGKDYTQKTMALAEEKRAFTNQQSQWAEKADAALKELDSLQEKEPNWLELRRSGNYTAEQYQEIQAWWADRSTKLNNARQMAENARRDEGALAARRTREFLMDGTYEPTWKDGQKLDEGMKKITEYALTQGYTREFLRSLSNPLPIISLDKARRFDEAQKGKPVITKAVSGKPAVAKAGAKTVATPSGETARLAEEKFNKNRNINDAVALFNARQTARRPAIRR